MGSDFQEIARTEWLSLRRISGPAGAIYDYVHILPVASRGATVLPYRTDHPEAPFLARVEACPPHGDGLAVVSIGGGVAPGEDPAVAACRELDEEGGLHATPDELVFVGTVRPSRVSDDEVFLFLFNATGREQGSGRNDGSAWEAGAHWRWVDVGTAVHSQDAKLGSLIARGRQQLQHGVFAR